MPIDEELSGEDWRQADRLFSEALELHPEERASFLDRRCPDNHPLRNVVETLLRESDEAESLFGTPGVEAAPELVRALAREMAGPDPVDLGRHVGPYRILRELGRGGSGVVYLAERDDRHYRQTVALKVLRRGLDTDDVVARFRAERQILASLTHPNIARLLDGGATEDGRPYLVMECVRGKPILQHCDAERMGVRERLRLFVRAARAVQYAHHNLVVHRDIKPSNILVDDTGTLKLLDFGIAKLLDPSQAFASTPVTLAGVRPMTPEYASPEQVRGDAVSAATDVYQLGLLLYELLTGRPARSLEGCAPGEIVRIVCHERLPKPSAVVAPRGGDETAARERAALRSTGPRRLSRTLRGDLDTIVLKALRTEPGRRYASAGEVASDVESYLANRPIRARPDSRRYRAEKFVRRHPAGIVAGAFLVVVVSIYLLTISAYAERLERERDRATLEAEKAEQVSAFVMDLFDIPELREGRGDTLTALMLLDRGARRLVDGDVLTADPSVRAATLEVLGKAHAGLGFYGEAAALLSKGVELRREMTNHDPADLAAALLALGDVKIAQRLHARAAPHYAEAVDLLDSRPEPPGLPMAEALFGLARAIRPDVQRSDSAAGLMRRAVTLRRDLQGEDHPDFARDLSALAYMTRDAADREAAVEAYEAVVARLRGAEGLGSELLSALHNLAYMYRRAGRTGEAEPLFLEAIEVGRTAMGEGHPRVLSSMGNLAELLEEEGRPQEAISLLERRHAIEVRHHGASHLRSGAAAGRVGRVHLAAGSPREALPWLESALASYGDALEADDPLIAESAADLGEALYRLGRVDEAASILLGALHALRQHAGEDDPRRQAAAQRLEALDAAMPERGMALRSGTTNRP